MSSSFLVAITTRTVPIVLFLLVTLTTAAVGAASSVASLSSSASSLSSSSSTSSVKVPIFTVQELITGRQQDYHRQTAISHDGDDDKNNDDRLREILATTGLFAVPLTLGGDDDMDMKKGRTEDHRSIALDGLCHCSDDLTAFSESLSSSFDPLYNDADHHHQGHHHHKTRRHHDQIRSMTLPDGQTHRVSVATATIGLDTPLPLPNDEEFLDHTCGPHVTQAMDLLRDRINSVTRAVLKALDRTLLLSSGNHNNGVPILHDVHGREYHSLTDLVRAATNLEHFHVYEKDVPASSGVNNSQQENQNVEDATAAAWEWHTDAGLFLVFVPAWDCNSNSNDDSNDNDSNGDAAFWYKDVHGNAIQAQFEPNTAVVMMGQGAQDWLNLHRASREEPPIRATVHSVRLSSTMSSRRAWYGTMQLVPDTALVDGLQTLKDVRSSLSYKTAIVQRQDDNDLEDGVVSLGCGTVSSTSSSSSSSLDESALTEDELDFASTALSRRRLQHQDPSACNNVTNFFCWMQCLEVPSADQAQGYVNEGYSLYCLDPSVLASSGNRVSQAAAPCENGWVHDPACTGSWQPTAPGVPAATINVTANVLDIEEAFCYGGTTMYMDGFHLVQGTTCVIYLFQSWALNTGGKFAIAFFGTILAGIGLEKVIQERRRVMAKLSTLCAHNPRARLAASAVFYGAQLTIGYMLMLVIMIYSGVLFLATVLGLVSGHVMFNAKDAIWPLKDPVRDDDEEDDNDDNDDDDVGPLAGDLEFEELHHGIDMEGLQYEPVALESLGNHKAAGLGTKSCCSKMDGTKSTTTDMSSTGIPMYGSTGGETGTVSTSSSKPTKRPPNPRENNNHGVAEGATPCCQHSL